jgi:hypothetical protein
MQTALVAIRGVGQAFQDWHASIALAVSYVPMFDNFFISLTEQISIRSRVWEILPRERGKFKSDYDKSNNCQSRQKLSKMSFGGSGTVGANETSKILS